MYTCFVTTLVCQLIKVSQDDVSTFELGDFHGFLVACSCGSLCPKLCERRRDGYGMYVLCIADSMCFLLLCKCFKFSMIVARLPALSSHFCMHHRGVPFVVCSLVFGRVDKERHAFTTAHLRTLLTTFLGAL